jgi:hypothetical protein
MEDGCIPFYAKSRTGVRLCPKKERTPEWSAPSFVSVMFRFRFKNRFRIYDSYFLFLETRATPPITAIAATAPATGIMLPVFGELVEPVELELLEEEAFLVVVVAA